MPDGVTRWNVGLMSKQLFPKEKPEPPEPDPIDRPWVVHYDLAYDGGGDSWDGYYRTKFGAKISAWWNYHIASWGGSAILEHRGKEE